jgi:HEAT repeat protein
MNLIHLENTAIRGESNGKAKQVPHLARGVGVAGKGTRRKGTVTRVVLLVALVVHLLSSAARGDEVLPEFDPEPLGLLVGHSSTIHVLQVEAVRGKRIHFKTKATLKGRSGDVPFATIDLWAGRPFRPGIAVLCFRRNKEMTILFAGAHRVYAVAPRQRIGGHWWGRTQQSLTEIYDGPTEVLCQHVGAILAGREITITARARWTSRRVTEPRLCRIRAGLKQTRFVRSDESIHFVGWGSGDPNEVANLIRVLRKGESSERIIAADDLGWLGAKARPALPALRQVMRDPDPGVALAAARALTRLSPADGRGLDSIQTRLKDPNSKVRSAAADSLADLGPLAQEALPALLRALKDRDKDSRSDVAIAVGHVAPGSLQQGEAVTALIAVLKGNQGRDPSAAVWSLRRFGVQAWTATPVLVEKFAALGDNYSFADAEAVALLARLNPPPVEWLGAIVADPRSSSTAQEAAAGHLSALGARAWAALPGLRRALAVPRETGTVAIAWTLHDIDPEGTAGLLAPVLLAWAKRKDQPSGQAAALSLLGRCGAAGRPAVALLSTLDPKTHDTGWIVERLTPLLGPQDRPLLPTLRRLLPGRYGDSLVLAKVLLRLRYRQEAMKQGARSLKSDSRYLHIEAARWLGQRGQEAKVVEPALRQEMTTATGAERVRLALALWRVRGGAEACPHGRALAALDAMTDHLAWGDELEDALAEILDRLRGGKPVPVLVRALESRDPHVRLCAAVALARVEPRHPGAVPTLRRLLARHLDFFGPMADTLSALGPRAAPLAPFVVPLLGGPDSAQFHFSPADHSHAALRVLGRIGPEEIARAWGSAGAPGAVPANLTPLWDDLASADGFRADLAIWRLAGAGSRAVALVRDRLRPAPSLPEKAIARLIVDLDSDAFATRERASATLKKVLEAAAPALRRARAARPSLEALLRINRLLADLDPPRDAEQRRRLRAVRLLGEMDVPEARALLQRLARDERFAVTNEATLALRQRE